MSGYDNENRPMAPKGARLAFGIFMIIIYVGMGVLFLMNVFNTLTWISIFIGVLLIVYGIFRGYRLYRGMN